MASTNVGMKDACDRCHNLKSRCIKLRNSSVCSRCQKHGSRCTYSPPLPVGRPKGKLYRSREPKETESMPRRSSCGTEGTPEELQNSSSPDHSLSKGNVDFVTGEMDSVKSIEDREIDLSPSPQSQLHSLPTPSGTTLGSIESDTHENDANSSELQKMPSHQPIVLPTTDPGPDPGCTSIDQALCPSGNQYGEDVQWQSMLGANTPSASDGNLMDLWSMPDWAIPPQLDSQWQDLALGRRLHAANGDREAGDAHPPSPSSTLHTRKCIDNLLIIQRDLYSLSESTCGASTAQAGNEEASNCRQSCVGNIEKMLFTTENLMNVIHTMNQTHGSTCSQVSGTCKCPADAHGDCHSALIPNTWGLADNSTVLLILSCYLRLLDVYESLAQFLRYSHQTWSPNATANAPGIPILALGNFSLGTSPDANVGVILHIVLDMVDRLQTAVNQCAVKATGDFKEESETSFCRGHTGSWGAGTYRASGRSGCQVDQAHGCSTGRATETFLRAMLSDVHERELGLIRNLHDLRQSVRGRWLDAFPLKV